MLLGATHLSVALSTPPKWTRHSEPRLMDQADGIPGIFLDLTLLRGFQFRCLDACGLCCYATPAAQPLEVSRLLQIEPEAPLISGPGSYSFIASQGDGGACHFLQDNRCRVHSVRPFPCREFPITVHIGDRVQAALVLSCPGVSLLGLDGFVGPLAGPSAGLEGEIDAVRSELGERPVSEWVVENARRRRRLERRLAREGRWHHDWERTRDGLLARLTLPPEDWFPPAPPPGADQPLESLPVFRDEELGRVAFREHPGGWEFLSLEEMGGVGRHLGVLPPPERCPALSTAAEHLYRTYLTYAMGRDQFYWGLLEEFANDDLLDSSVEEAAEERLLAMGTQVLSRASMRARLRGRPGDRLDVEELDWGIRATDAEIIDAPTLGRVL